MKLSKVLIALSAVTMLSGAANADGMMFEPVDVNYTPSNQAVTTSVDATTPAENSLIQNAQAEKFQNAILELDAAQVDLRNNYLSYKEKYTKVDAQYHAIKEERKSTAKTVRALEKKIKEIESTKSKIRKTMQ